MLPYVVNAVHELLSVLKMKREDTFGESYRWTVGGKTVKSTKFESEHWRGVRLCLVFTETLGLLPLVFCWMEAHKASALGKESHQCGSHLVLL